MHAYSLHRHTCMCTCPLHRSALRCACPSYMRTCVHACSAYRGAFMHPYHEHMRASKCSYPIHSCAHMRGCVANMHTHNADLFPPYKCPRARLSGGQACTYARILLDRPRTWGPTPIKPPVRPSIQAPPKNGNPTSMQDDKTTNLKLTGPGLAALFSQNLQISSKYLSSSHSGSKYK